ncbi:MAG: hypothetical protein ABI591_03260 [Kofleriaceae bacterium]
MKAAIVLVCLMACGPSNGDDVMGDGGPGSDGSGNGKLIATGGVSNAPLGGTLHVFAVENNSATPIANAAVQVGTLTGKTDASGLATFNDASLTGKVTITVSAPGHAAATWVGVTGANVTVPLETTPRNVPTATVTGTITGFDSLGAIPLGHYHLGVVLYSFLNDPSAPENSLVQPTVSGAPADACVDSSSGGTGSCSWSLVTRIGPQVHFALILDGDSKFTASDTSDDTYTLIGYAAGSTVTMATGQTMAGEALTMVPASQNFAVTFPPAPGGLGTTIAIPELELDGGAGRIVFPVPAVNPGHTSTKVITPTGNLAGHYEVVALATPNATATTPYATAFVHNVTTSAAVPAWLAQPTALAAGATFSFTGTGAYVTAQISRAKQPLWDITILDGSTSFTLPTVTPDPIGSGMTNFGVNLADAPGFDAGSFDVASATASLVRVAGAQTSFTR